MKDPIVQEVRRIRKQIEDEHGNDWDALVRHFVQKQRSSSAKSVSYQPRKLPDRGVA